MTAVQARKGRAITVDIDGEERTYTLRLSFLALAQFEDESGRSVLAWASTMQTGGEAEMLANITFKDILLVIKAALSGGGHECELPEVSDIAEAYGLAETMELFGKLMVDAFVSGKARGRAGKKKAPAKS